MKRNESIDAKNEAAKITEEEFKEFITATGERQWEILLAHAEKNSKIITSKKVTGDNK